MSSVGRSMGYEEDTMQRLAASQHLRPAVATVHAQQEPAAMEADATLEVQLESPRIISGDAGWRRIMEACAEQKYGHMGGAEVLVICIQCTSCASQVSRGAPLRWG